MEPPKDNKDKLAVALEYDRASDPAPRIIASGKGLIAAQIIEVAKQHNIEIRQDAELVQILSVLDIDSIIPVEAYAAVAEILSYIYKTNRQSKKS